MIIQYFKQIVKPVFLLLCLVTLVGCDKYYLFIVKNGSTQPLVTTMDNFQECWESFFNPEWYERQDIRNLMYPGEEVQFSSWCTWGSVASKMENGVVPIYIMSFDTSWLNLDTVPRSDTLAIYYMTENDFKHFEEVTFPPSEAMRNIKMWPPYGYYDSNGHPVQKH